MERTGQENKTNSSSFWLGLVIATIVVLILLGVWGVVNATDWFAKGRLQNSGVIGDYFNGIIGPFIAFSGVITTFAAFLIQYKANQAQSASIQEQQVALQKQQDLLKDQLDASKNANLLREAEIENQRKSIKAQENQVYLQKEQLRIDRFEQRFFEMLRIHRENAASMKFEGTPYIPGEPEINEEAYWGRPIVYQHHEVIEGINVEFESVFKFLEWLVSKNLIPEMNSFQIASWAYGIVFVGKSGVPEDWLLAEAVPQENSIRNRNLKDAFLAFENRGVFDFNEYHNDFTAEISKEVSKVNRSNNAPKMLQGYVRQLSAYFRHLFQMVDQLDQFKAEGFTDDERMRYAKLLRAQLTDEDQLLLYYNSLWSGAGEDWWRRGFITKYKFIKQVPFARIPNEISPVKRLSQALGGTKDLEVLQEYFDTGLTADMLL